MAPAPYHHRTGTPFSRGLTGREVEYHKRLVDSLQQKPGCPVGKSVDKHPSGASEFSFLQASYDGFWASKLAVFQMPHPTPRLGISYLYSLELYLALLPSWFFLSSKIRSNAAFWFFRPFLTPFYLSVKEHKSMVSR